MYAVMLGPQYRVVTESGLPMPPCPDHMALVPNHHFDRDYRAWRDAIRSMGDFLSAHAAVSSGQAR